MVYGDSKYDAVAGAVSAARRGPGHFRPASRRVENR